MELQQEGSHSTELPKLVCARAGGSSSSTSCRKNDPKLVGDVNEVNVLVQSVKANALLDTGSCVSIISESFYKNKLSDIEMEPLTDLINIECADGQPLPYLGCIEAQIAIESGLEGAKPQSCIFFISPETKYLAQTPIILGTNILQPLLEDCKDSFGEQFLQRAKLNSPFYLSFRTISIRERI